jgi:ubiquinone/menaquinone biosynthesis C-methylase UbiE
VPRRVDYDEHQHAVYAAGRGLTAPISELWTGIFARYIDARTRPTILDLGSGTGMYSQLLARQFDARVVGVEPSRRMREIAEREHAHDHVRYIEGTAGQIPVGDASCDVALLSNVIHHVEDRHACAAELDRVVRPGGLVLLRGTLLDSVPGVPFFDFFPTALAIDMQRMPSVDELAAVFASHGLEKVHGEVVRQQSAVDLQAYYDRIRHRAVSTLELIDDEDFEQGLERMREAARREHTPTPVFEPVNLVVFRRR